MLSKLKALVQLVVLSIGIIVIFSAGVSAMGLSLKASWDNGSAPMLVDLDNDSSQEIISPFSYQDQDYNVWNYLHVWYGNGTSFGNWSANFSANVNSNPAVEDINNDTQKEVVFSDQSGILHVYYNNGTEIWSNDACSLEWRTIESSPILADFDSNRNFEIIFSCHIPFVDASIYMLDHEGNPMPEWEIPKSVGDTSFSPTVIDNMVVVSGGMFGFPAFYVQAFYFDGTDAWLINPDGDTSIQSATSSPVIGNVDENGQEEIIVSSSEYDFYNPINNITKIYVIDKNSIVQSFWNISAEGLPSPTILSDIDGDGMKDIIIYLYDTVYVWNGSGSLLWSQLVGGISSPKPNEATTVADINNDSLSEVMVPAANNLLVFSNTGSLLLNKSFDDFPELLNSTYSLNTPAIGDVDGDGKKDIVIGVDTFNKIYVFDVCSESWSCSDWSSCSGGTQTRICTDQNQCNTTQNKPGETQSCTVPSGGGEGGGGYYCIVNWTCTEFSPCQPDGAQTRNCTDRNNCIGAPMKPAEKQNCTYIPPSHEVELPECGDGKCDSSETCSDCPKDCGSCPTPSNQSEENATGQPEVTGQAILSPIDSILVMMIIVLGVVVIIAVKK